MKLDKSERSAWESVFVKRPESPWITSYVSVVMPKQFLTRQVTKAAMAKVVFQRSLPKHMGSTVSNFALCEDDMIWETNQIRLRTFSSLCVIMMLPGCFCMIMHLNPSCVVLWSMWELKCELDSVKVWPGAGYAFSQIIFPFCYDVGCS